MKVGFSGHVAAEEAVGVFDGAALPRGMGIAEVGLRRQRSDFRISDLGCGKYPMSLYLQVPPSDRDRIMPLFRMIIMQFSKVLFGMWWKVP